RRGSLELVVREQIVDGKLTMFTRTLPILRGRCEGSQISFAGDMKTLTEMIPYRAEGTVNGSRIDILFTTRKGNYPAVGRQEIAGQRKGTAT
ncbi:MAG: hypothetical protein ACI3VA_09750, partial [Candidatus Limivicinus sp.]